MKTDQNSIFNKKIVKLKKFTSLVYIILAIYSEYLNTEIRITNIDLKTGVYNRCFSYSTFLV